MRYYSTKKKDTKNCVSFIPFAVSLIFVVGVSKHTSSEERASTTSALQFPPTQAFPCQHKSHFTEYTTIPILAITHETDKACEIQRRVFARAFKTNNTNVPLSPTPPCLTVFLHATTTSPPTQTQRQISNTKDCNHDIFQRRRSGQPHGESQDRRAL